MSARTISRLSAQRSATPHQPKLLCALQHNLAGLLERPPLDDLSAVNRAEASLSELGSHLKGDVKRDEDNRRVRAGPGRAERPGGEQGNLCGVEMHDERGRGRLRLGEMRRQKQNECAQR